MVRLANGILVELLYHASLRFEKVVAWWLGRKKAREPPVREIWIHRREAAEGYLGRTLNYKPKPRIIRLLELMAWYSPLGQLMVWRIKRSDW